MGPYRLWKAEICLRRRTTPAAAHPRQTAAKNGGKISVDDLSDTIAGALKGTKDASGKKVPAKDVRKIADAVSTSPAAHPGAHAPVAAPARTYPPPPPSPRQLTVEFFQDLAEEADAQEKAKAGKAGKKTKKTAASPAKKAAAVAAAGKPKAAPKGKKPSAVKVRAGSRHWQHWRARCGGCDD